MALLANEARSVGAGRLHGAGADRAAGAVPRHGFARSRTATSPLGERRSKRLLPASAVQATHCARTASALVSHRLIRRASVGLCAERRSRE